MKTYIPKENEAVFYRISMYSNGLLTLSSGGMFVSRVLQGKGISYFWLTCVMITMAIAINSVIKYKKASTKKDVEF